MVADRLPGRFEGLAHAKCSLDPRKTRGVERPEGRVALLIDAHRLGEQQPGNLGLESGRHDRPDDLASLREDVLLHINRANPRDEVDHEGRQHLVEDGRLDSK